MNKVYIFILSISIAFMGNAQNQIFNSEAAIDHEIAQDVKVIDNTVVKDLKVKSTKGSHEAWFHQPSAVADFIGLSLSTFKSSSMTLFKDTSVLVNYSSGIAPIWSLAAAQITDPTGDMFDFMETNDEFNIASKYTFDSIAFTGLYIRHSASTVIDTLVIQIQDNSYRFNPMQYGSNPNDSLIGLPAIFHNLHTWEVTSSTTNVKSVTTIKIPLDTTFASRDTMVNGSLQYFYKTFEFATDMPTKIWSSGDLPKISIGFISGSTYTPHVDTLIGATDPFINSFRLRAFKSQDATPQLFIAGDRSCSYNFTRQYARASSTNSYFAASYFYGATFNYEYFDIYTKYSTNNVSIDDTKQNNITVSQNQPNPFNGTSKINYNLNKSAKVNIAIYNIAGAQIMNIEEGTKTAGKHNLEINASNLPAGVYFYTFTADNYSVTKKMIVY